jgi:hypothetical protein
MSKWLESVYFAWPDSDGKGWDVQPYLVIRHDLFHGLDL